MKHLNVFANITLAAILAFTLAGSSFSQSLQFSQVKLVTAQETVPAAKVWKVESVVYNIPVDQSSYQGSGSAGCSPYYHRSAAIYVNGIPTKVGSGTQPAAYTGVDYTHTYTMLPLWLPAGATLSGGPCNNQVSVIEFSVVP